MNEYVIMTDSLSNLTEEMLASYDIHVISDVDRFFSAFEQVLKQGKDVLFIGLSSAVSKTTGEARRAAESLDLFYPSNSVFVVDSVNTTLGEGFLAKKAALLRAAGKSIFDVVSWIEKPIR